MRDPRDTGTVEDYTKPFFVAAGVLLFMFLAVIWAIWGLIAALFSGWTMDRLIVFGGSRMQDRR